MNNINTFAAFDLNEAKVPDNLPTKGLLAFVYKRADGDATAGGITSKAKQVVVVGPGIPPVFSGNKDTPLVFIDNIGKHVIARPVEQAGEKEGTYMFGGNFIYTSDSRFPENYPIPVHDRFESWDTYNAMSRS